MKKTNILKFKCGFCGKLYKRHSLFEKHYTACKTKNEFKKKRCSNIQYEKEEVNIISLNRKLRISKWFLKNNLKEPNLINYLDLVSLGTICDVVPLIGLNRAIVKQGLKIIKSKKFSPWFF